jgi:hypothetical protein
MASMEETDALGQWSARARVCVCAVALGLALPVVASAAERKVLGELFVQSDYCPPCEDAAGTVSGMIDQYPDTLVVVEYHVVDDTTPFGNERAESFYNIWSRGVPWFELDGVDYVRHIDNYEQEFQTRESVSTAVTLSLGAELTSNGAWSVTGRACTEPDGVPLNLHLYLVVVEDDYPDVTGDWRNTCRMGFEPEAVDLTTNSCHEFSRDVALDPSWTQSELKIIAWAQDQAAAAPANVHQAAEQAWPFEPLPALGDWDNDGDADLDDFDGFDTCLSGPGAAPPPSQRCLDTFDADQDGDVDVADYAAIQRELSPPSP